MKADYKNWVPKGMIYGLGAAAAGLAGEACVIEVKHISSLLAVGALGCGAYLAHYQKHFKDPVIHLFDMEHEELLVEYPNEWVAKIKEVCI